MKLPKKLKELKSEIESLLQKNEQLWDRYESNQLDHFIENAGSGETFELGWELGHYEGLQYVLTWIETLENPY